MIIVFAGTIGQSGLGGQAWANMQFLAGFHALGHDVFYLEDCDEWSSVYNWQTNQLTTDLSYPAAYIRQCLEPFGLKDKWIFRRGNRSEGIPIKNFKEVCSEADLLVMRAVPLWQWRDEYNRPQRRIFIDVDPGFTQISIANGDQGWITAVSRCDKIFTIGQRIGIKGCSIPTEGYDWLKTLPPVSLTDWLVNDSEEATHFTSVIRWQGFRNAHYGDSFYGQRDKEFPKFLDLPRLTSQPYRMALLKVAPEYLANQGWDVVPGDVVSQTPDSYHNFIQQSRAEFSVPKHGYVSSQGGWFSDRSVCYLASGKPVLMEDTGLKDWLPIGLPFLAERCFIK